jgi:putative two-component system response regulator
MTLIGTAPHRVLVVEEGAAVAQLLRQGLATEGQEVDVSAHLADAFARVLESLPDLILLDLDTPALDGAEFCRRVKGHPATRFVPVIIVTALTPAEAKLRAWELGADDFLTRPFHSLEVVARCRSMLRVKALIDDLDSAEAVVFAFARAIEAKSPYTQGHAERVATYALTLAASIGLPEDKWETLRNGALLHDIGKISIPDAILEKPTALTPEEFEIVKLHTVQGARIVEPLRSIRDAVPLIRWHHERLDGHGYPDHLAAAEIPLLVRVLAVADVYDSLASKRPYRTAIPHELCLELLHLNATSGGLDAELVRIFSGLPGLGTPAALARMDQVWKSFPRRRDVPALPLAAPPPPAEAPAPPDAETQPDVTPISDNLIKSWSWDKLKEAPAAPAPAEEARQNPS